MQQQMTGRLRVLNQVLAAFADDLADVDSSVAEREVAATLVALRSAISLGATGEIAHVAQRWMDGYVTTLAHAMPLDDQWREDAIAGLGRDV